MKKVLLLLFVLVLVLAGWTLRYRIKGLLGMGPEEVPYETPPSEQLAQFADDKLQQLKDGRADQVSFHAAELQSLLMFRFVQLLPAFVDSPHVHIREGKIEVAARIPVEHLPNISELGEAAGFLPDTTEVELIGTLIPLDSGRVGLSIEEVRAAQIPLPHRLVPNALQKLGRKPEKGLPKNALALPLPGGVGSAVVEHDSLILRRRHP